MSIFLPKEAPLFQASFEGICNQIRQSKYDEVFYSQLVELTSKLREHPLLRESIFQVETASVKRQKEYSNASLEVHEYHWKKLWRYHSHSYRHRKDLVRIKRVITSPNECSSSPLHIRIGRDMWEFRYHSPFFRAQSEASLLFRKAQSDLRLWVTLSTEFSSSKKEKNVFRKISQFKFKNGDLKAKLHLKVPLLRIPKKALKFKWTAEPIYALFSPLIDELERKFGLPGINNDVKQRNALIRAETDFGYCWERFQFLEQCYKVSEPIIRRFHGKWESIRETAWHSAWERCENETLKMARWSFINKLISSTNSLHDTYLSCEKQIHRRHYEQYLKALQRHIYTLLLIIESSKVIPEEVPHPNLVTNGTQRANFVIDLAKQCWKAQPLAKRDEAYTHYLSNCPRGKTLSRSSWDRIIRERKLDRRPPESKTRGKSKKSLQN